MKKIMLVFAFLTVLYITYVPAVNANSNLSVNIKFGYDQVVAPNETLPVFVNITNNGEDFEGDFVYDNEELYNGGTGVVIPIDIASGETQTHKFFIHGLADNYINVSTIKEQVHVYEGGIESGQKVKVDLSQIKSPKLLDYEAQRMLLISNVSDILETVEKLRAPSMSNVEVSQATASDLSRLTNDIQDYEMYKVIVVDTSGVKLLKPEYIQAIANWNRRGGTLFLVGNITLQDIPSALTFSSEGAKASEEATLKQLAGGVDVATLTNGDGSVIQTSVSLNDPSLVDNAELKRIFSDSLKPNYEQNYAVDEAYRATQWSYDNGLFETFYYNTKLILGFLMLYIVIVAPILYWILKKRDKREKMWLYIPIIAVVASLLLFAIGAKDRLLKPQTQSMELVTLNGAGDAYIDTAYSFVSNARGKYEITAPKDVSLIANFENFNAPTQDIHKHAFTTLEDDSQTLTYIDVPYWSVQTAVAEQYVQNVGQLSSDLRISNNRLTGTVTNELNVTLQEVRFISGSNVVDLEEMKAGQTVQVDQEVEFSTLKRPVSVGFYGDENMNNSDSAIEKMLQNKKFSLIRSAIDSNSSDMPLLVGIAETQMSSLQLTKDHKTKALTLFAQTATVELDVTGSLTLQSSDFIPTLTAVNPNHYGELYEEAELQASITEGEYILEFKLADGILKKEMDWSDLEVNFNASILTVEIYNTITKKYEPLAASPWSPEDKVIKYIGDNEAIQFKISTTDEHYGAFEPMPTFKLKGEAK